MKRLLPTAALAISLLIPGLLATGCAVDPTTAVQAPREEKEVPTGSRIPRL